jgi:hypothetical protein
MNHADSIAVDHIVQDIGVDADIDAGLVVRIRVLVLDLPVREVAEAEREAVGEADVVRDRANHVCK